MKSLLVECMRAAIRSPHQRKFKHYSFIISDNRIMSMGKNVQTYEFSRNIHSEVSAWNKADKKRLDDFYIINIRLKELSTGMSCPCNMCMKFLRNIGCSKVVFTTGESWATIKL